MRIFILLIDFLGLAVPAFAQTMSLLNLDSDGLALQGYDPVAFFTDGKPVKGEPQFRALHGGRCITLLRRSIGTFSARSGEI